MDDLVQFLRDRYDEHEARLRALPAGPWAWHRFEDPGAPESDGLVGPGGTVLASADAECYKSWIDRHEAFDAYLQDIQPARALADTEAKRQILAAYEGWQARIDEGEDLSEFERGSMAGLYAALRILADI
jgi:hypothetical protein